eukprot:gene9042-6343_t
MNANAYSLLNAVLRDRPCIDPSLNTMIETAPFAVLSIAQQCFYILHMVSVTRALLYNEQSAYTQTVQRLAEKLPEEKDSARTVLLPSRHLSAQPSQSMERGASVASASSAAVSPTTPALQVAFLPPEDVPRLVLPPPPPASQPLQLVPVVPACKLDIAIAIVGGGTVVRRLLHLLLDEHPSFLHPTRITVITRQPEKLNVFAAQGVMCLHRKHGTEALNRCHALIIACQPSQLDDFIQNHFSAKAYGNDPLHQVAKLRRSTMVISCLAAFPKVKLAALLHHDERLVLRTSVAATTVLPEIAADHVRTGRECTAVKVQMMADCDSFLRDAVLEAERHRIDQAVSRIMDLQYATKAGEHTAIPEDIARRAALNSVLEADRSKVNPKNPSERLRETQDVTYGFLAGVWGAIQAYVKAEFDIKEGEKAKKAEALQHMGERLGGGARDDATIASTHRSNIPSVAHKRKGKNEAQSAAKQTEGPFLCAALATLPPSVHLSVVQTVISRYAPPSPHASLFGGDLSVQPSGKDRFLSSVASSFQGGGGRAAGGTSLTRAALRRLANIYPEESLFVRHLQEQYSTVVQPEAGAGGHHI